MKAPPATALVACVALVGACDWSAQRMVDQDRCEADEPTRHFADGDCNRTPPAGTVAWHARSIDPATPPPLTRGLVERGRDRFGIFCTPCHGLVGDGQTQVSENMTLRRPSSLHEPRVVALDDHQLYDIVTGGYGLMPSYRAQLEVADRWAVVAYVRALQLSQRVAVDRLPAARREEAAPWLR